MSRCPCGSDRALEACCGPYLTGAQDAPTPEALARARYTAYTRTDVNFLLRTYAPDRQYLFDRETTLAWARRSRWTGFEIRRTAETAADDEAEVEFIAWYERAGRAFRHHEIGQFRREGGRWYYIDGTYPSSADLLGDESKRLKGMGAG